ncbi:MAG: Dephospho-CoA kinase [Parabacteroides sp.]
MIKIGITGGIGSGKSVVASLLALNGVPVYIADTESKLLTVHSPIIRKGLTDLFGIEIYTDEGLNKPLLASHIFGDQEKLKQVNGIIHPEVNRHFQEWAEQQQADICAIESAILFESGFDRIVDATLMVYAPLETRIRRALERDTVSREAIISRINSQMPDEIKKEKCDYIIYNDDKHALLPQVTEFIRQLRKKDN